MRNQNIDFWSKVQVAYVRQKSPCHYGHCMCENECILKIEIWICIIKWCKVTLNNGAWMISCEIYLLASWNKSIS